MKNENQQIDYFDALCMSIIENHSQGAARLVDTVAGFLSRKTDFFIGTLKGNWQHLVLQTFQKYEIISLDAEEDKFQQCEEALHKAAETRRTKLDAANTPQCAQVTELTEETEKL